MSISVDTKVDTKIDDSDSLKNTAAPTRSNHSPQLARILDLTKGLEYAPQTQEEAFILVREMRMSLEEAVEELESKSTPALEEFLRDRLDGHVSTPRASRDGSNGDDPSDPGSFKYDGGSEVPRGNDHGSSGAGGGGQRGDGRNGGGGDSPGRPTPGGGPEDDDRQKKRGKGFRRKDKDDQNDPFRSRYRVIDSEGKVHRFTTRKDFLAWKENNFPRRFADLPSVELESLQFTGPRPFTQNRFVGAILKMIPRSRRIEIDFGQYGVITRNKIPVEIKKAGFYLNLFKSSREVKGEADLAEKELSFDMKDVPTASDEVDIKLRIVARLGTRKHPMTREIPRHLEISVGEDPHAKDNPISEREDQMGAVTPWDVARYVYFGGADPNKIRNYLTEDVTDQAKRLLIGYETEELLPSLVTDPERTKQCVEKQGLIKDVLKQFVHNELFIYGMHAERIAIEFILNEERLQERRKAGVRREAKATAQMDQEVAMIEAATARERQKIQAEGPAEEIRAMATSVAGYLPLSEEKPENLLDDAYMEKRRKAIKEAMPEAIELVRENWRNKSIQGGNATVFMGGDADPNTAFMKQMADAAKKDRSRDDDESTTEES